MALQQQDKQNADRELQQAQHLQGELGKHVLKSLGRPNDLYGVQVRPLWDDRYRANVFVGKQPDSVKLAHSYFLVVDSEGNVVTSTPRITKLY